MPVRIVWAVLLVAVTPSWQTTPSWHGSALSWHGTSAPRFPSALASSAGASEHTTRRHPGSLKALLRRAAGWVQRFTDESTFVVADELYEQEYRYLSRSEWRSERRALRSEIVIVPAPPGEARRGFPWVQFRDVQQVDGRPIADHQGRLERLFRDPSGSSYAQARALVEESARFNIGPTLRTINVPAFALFFLVAGNQSRFKFERQGEEAIEGIQATAIRYRERQHPTIIRGPGGEDRVAEGTFWIDEATGQVARTHLEVDADRPWRTEIDVDYGHDARLDAWVPTVMRERYASGPEEVIDCTAMYSNFRRFETAARMVIPR